MIDFDLDRLGDVWRQQPNQAELESLKRSADAVRRRTRWAQLVDVVAAVVVAAVVLLLVLSNPKIETLLVGGAAILMLLGSEVRSRRLRQEEVRSLTGSAEQMLDQSISRMKATIKRTRFQLLSAAPGLLLGILFAYVVDDGAAGALRRLSADPFTRTTASIVLLFFMTALILYLVRTLRGSRRELERLVALREAYRGEQDPDDISA